MVGPEPWHREDCDRAAIIPVMQTSWALGKAFMQEAGFPKISGTFLEVPRTRTLVFLGVYIGCPCFGKLPGNVNPRYLTRSNVDAS